MWVKIRKTLPFGRPIARSDRLWSAPFDPSAIDTSDLLASPTPRGRYTEPTRFRSISWRRNDSVLRGATRRATREGRGGVGATRRSDAAARWPAAGGKFLPSSLLTALPSSLLPASPSSLLPASTSSPASGLSPLSLATRWPAVCFCPSPSSPAFGFLPPRSLAWPISPHI
jgi:hypothetical protein